jgi:hypothetical protein
MHNEMIVMRRSLLYWICETAVFSGRRLRAVNSIEPVVTQRVKLDPVDSSRKDLHFRRFRHGYVASNTDSLFGGHADDFRNGARVVQATG